MPTQVTLAYTVDVQAPNSVANLVALLTAVQLNADIIPILNCTQVSDVVTNDATSATRTLVYSLFATPNLYPLTPNPSSCPFRGTVVSSSPNDKMGGSGLQQLKIVFVDKDNVESVEMFEMKGTKPVVSINGNKKFLKSFAPYKGTPQGLVVLSKGNPVNAAASGDRSQQILGNFRGTILSTSDSDVAGRAGATMCTVNYLDDVAAPHATTVSLAGKTPVMMPVANIATVVSIVPDKPNLGIISIYTGDAATVCGAPACTLPPSFNASYPDGTDQKAPFRDLFTHQIAQGVGAYVTAAPPVLA
jgi:hypothetical protein